MSRLLHTAATFFILAAVYLAYAATVVPLVEPQRRTRGHGGDSDVRWDELLAPESKYAGLFEALFPADHWTRSSPPLVFETDQGMIVVRDYDTHQAQESPGTTNAADSGRLTVKPCVMVYFPTAWSRGQGPPPSDAVILEAPEGCVLQFDGPIRLVPGAHARLENAWLTGPVVIKSDMQEPGPADDLEITTRDVAVTERRIWTDTAVELRIGPHFGRGRTLEVRFLPGEQKKSHDAFNVAGVEWIQLMREVELTLRPDRLAAGGMLGPMSGRPDSGAVSDAEGEIAVSCAGPLFFDVARRTAEFDRAVEVFFVHSNGPSDRLACDNLQITFAEQAKVVGEKRFEPVRLVASGQPVTVTSEARKLLARSRRLVYDVPGQQLTLEAITTAPAVLDREGQHAPPVALPHEHLCDLRHGAHRVQAARIEYAWDREAPRGRLGTLHVSGPGVLTSVHPHERASRTIRAAWGESLQLIRQEGEPVLSLFGRPTIEGFGVGRLAADELHIWLHEIEPAQVGAAEQTAGAIPTRDGLQITPDRLLARRNVEIDAPQLAARVGQLEAWLESPRAEGTSPGGGPAADSSVGHGSRWELASDNAHGGKSYYVEAERLQIRGLLAESTADGPPRQVEITHFTLDGAVLLEEQLKSAPGEPSVRVEADWLHAADVHTLAVQIHAKGRPLVARAGGSTLRGGEIRFDHAANLFEVPTPGDLSLLVAEDLEGRPLAAAVPLTISWEGGLRFDGRQAVLTDNVLARTPEQQLRTRRLSAALRTPVPLEKLQSEAGAEFEKLECTGGVVLDRQTFDSGGLASQEHFEFPNLLIERSLQRIAADGPGWLRHVGLTPQESLVGASTGAKAAPRAIAFLGGNASPTSQVVRASTDSATLQSGLTYLRIDYQRAMNGNLKSRDITFEGQVQCVRGPVASWDQAVHVAGLDQLPADTFVLNAASLRVGERSTATARWHELEAAGNVEVEGGLGENGIFTAHGARLTYDERKDLVILDGGAGLAELVHEASLGGKRYQTRPRTIQYSPSRRSLRADGLQQISGSF